MKYRVECMGCPFPIVATCVSLVPSRGEITFAVESRELQIEKNKIILDKIGE